MEDEQELLQELPEAEPGSKEEIEELQNTANEAVDAANEAIDEAEIAIAELNDKISEWNEANPGKPLRPHFDNIQKLDTVYVV